jgi:gliding motility-associated-like protein
VQALPVANFTTQNLICDPQDNAIFTNTTIPATGTSQTWDFGDGSFSVAHDPIRNYLGPATYNVTLTVVAGNCTATITKPVVVSQKPTASFTIQQADQCQNTPFTFEDNSSILFGAISLREWDFGEPPIAIVQDPVYNPVHPYIAANPDPGYTVSLIVTASSGCKDTMTQIVPVFPLPVASFTAPEVCDGVPMEFESSSTISYGSINQYTFDFGDNSSFNGDSTNHLYASAGTYAATLTVVSDQACIGQSISPVEVNPLPEAAFVMDDDEGCTTHTVRFSSGSSPINPPHQIIEYEWDFQNGNTSDDLAPAPENFATGIYDVTLIVKSIDGCTDTLVEDSAVTVHPLPVADFSTDNETVGILDPSVIVINESQGWQSCVIDYGDGNTDNIVSLIEHIYSDTGMYHLFLTAVNEFGCIDTISRYVHVIPDFAFYAPNAFTPNHDLKNEVWSGKGLAFKTYELLIFNRYGEEIFRSKNPEETWDGSVRDFNNSETGRVIKQDIYVYKVNILDNNDVRHIYTGRLFVYPDTEKKLVR